MGEAGWFGDLYRETTEDLLGPGLSAAEAGLVAELLRLRPGERVLDVACGQARHLKALGRRGLALVGIDRNGDYLRRATSIPTAGGEGGFSLVRADLRSLPFGRAFDAAFSWYSSLFVFEDRENVAALAEVARVLRPGGRLLVQHANPLRLAREPAGRARRRLPGGAVVEEDARFDPATGREGLSRRLVRGSEVLTGRCELRYYTPDGWGELARAAGLRPPRLRATGPGGAPVPFEAGSIDLIAVLEAPT
ncbi:MAG TPA: methyltransferase domain-containing protein [Anaeromyxobacteraceae bacterium]